MPEPAGAPASTRGWAGGWGKEGEEKEAKMTRKERSFFIEESGSWYGSETKVNLRSQKSQHTCRCFKGDFPPSPSPPFTLSPPPTSHLPPLPESAIRSWALPRCVQGMSRSCGVGHDPILAGERTCLPFLLQQFPSCGAASLGQGQAQDTCP